MERSLIIEDFQVVLFITMIPLYLFFQCFYLWKTVITNYFIINICCQLLRYVVKCVSATVLAAVLEWRVRNLFESGYVLVWIVAPLIKWQVLDYMKVNVSIVWLTLHNPSKILSKFRIMLWEINNNKILLI